ncbi:MAG: DUF4093 domain-containing protein [Oscillospiraceae bacterium]|nr:DUF4093 domain-containing protein [Oscillospiraceae bacterium]
MPKIKLNQTIIVEGKYDKIKLKSIIDANIITTDGFRIYNNIQKRALIKNIAEKTGVIILTDSDSAGKKIRNFIKSCVGEEKIINVYIPRISGKERRKPESSKENVIGVEGIGKDLLTEILKKFGVAECDKKAKTKKITKIDFYDDGLSGKQDSSEKRKYLCEKLDIPYMQANSLIEAVNILLDYSEYKKIIGEFDSENK